MKALRSIKNSASWRHFPKIQNPVQTFKLKADIEIDGVFALRHILLPFQALLRHGPLKLPQADKLAEPNHRAIDPSEKIITTNLLARTVTSWPQELSHYFLLQGSESEAPKELSNRKPFLDNPKYSLSITDPKASKFTPGFQST